MKKEEHYFHSMHTLNFILDKFGLTPHEGMIPFIINNFGRNELAELFSELGFKTGVEVGIEQGVYSEILCRSNPGLKLYCVDPWKAYRGYRDHVDQNKLDRFFVSTEVRLAPFGCVLVRKFSMDAVKDFENGSLDFVYIDGNHSFQNVVNDICEWSKKVKAGGIISGHDFIHRGPSDRSQQHVIEAVTGYTQAYHIDPWFILGRKHPREGEIRDTPRSFMWVKTMDGR